jgi:sulfatase maturation enzyme AslB (radical SAM superfamily)
MNKLELIIKPTSKCNFSCSFCAASTLDVKHPNSVPDQLKEVLGILRPDGIIITGGEPLCCSPDYYEELLELCGCSLSFTTNLKDFYLNPDKWTKLFNNPRVNVCTSFNYGKTRLWNKDTVYDEETFRKVMALFKERVRYVPPFIAVISEENEDTYLKHVHFAKELGTRCRLNNALKMGRQSTYYPRYKMFQKWLELIEMGLDKYEINCSERAVGCCPTNSNLMCQSTIRCIYIDSENNIHYGDCEDKINMDAGLEIELDTERPEAKPQPIKYNEAINDKCTYCELFNICNGCSTNREQAKESPEYCSEMLKLKDGIIKAGWKL